VTPVDGSGAIIVVAENTSFSVERIEVRAGATTTISLENRDAVPHTLTVYVGESATGDVLADSGQVAGGETGEAVALFGAPGEHAFRCEIHPERMSGTLVAR
jgi:plastocyanin